MAGARARVPGPGAHGADSHADLKPVLLCTQAVHVYITDLGSPPVELHDLGGALEAEHPVLAPHVLRPQGEVEAERHKPGQPRCQVTLRGLRTVNRVDMSEMGVIGEIDL